MLTSRLAGLEPPTSRLRVRRLTTGATEVGHHQCIERATGADNEVYCLLSSVKRDTLKKWYHEGMDTKLATTYAEELGETVLSFTGRFALSTDHLIYPNTQRRTTEPYPELTMSNLHFIIKVDNDPFSMEVVVEDSKNEDRIIRLNSTIETISSRPLICILPLPLHNIPWTQFTLDLNHLVNVLYDTKYTRLKLLKISSTCKLRKIFLTKMQNYTVRMLLNPSRAASTKSKYIANKYRMNRAAGFRLATQNQNKDNTAMEELVPPNPKPIPEKKKTDVSQSKRTNVSQSKKTDFSEWKNKFKTMEETSLNSVKRQTKSAILRHKSTNMTNVSTLNNKSVQILENTKVTVENQNITCVRKPNARDMSEKNKPKGELKETSLENYETFNNQNEVKFVADDHKGKIVEKYVDKYMRNRLENAVKLSEDLIAMKLEDAQERKEERKLGQTKAVVIIKNKSEELLGTDINAEVNEETDNGAITMNGAELNKVIELKVTPVIRRRESKVLTTEKKPVVKPGSPTISGKVRKVIRKPSAGIKNNAIKTTLPTTNAIKLEDPQESNEEKKLGQTKAVVIIKNKSEELLGTDINAEVNEETDNGAITMNGAESNKVIERKVTPVIRRRESKVLTTEKKPIVKPRSPTISGKVRKVIRKPSAGIKNNAIKTTLPTTNAIKLEDAQENNEERKLGQTKAVVIVKNKSVELLGTDINAEVNEETDNGAITMNGAESNKVIERKVTPVIRRRESKVLTTEKKPAVKPGSPTISGKVRKVIRKPSAGIKNNAIKTTLPTTNAIKLEDAQENNEERKLGQTKAVVIVKNKSVELLGTDINAEVNEETDNGAITMNGAESNKVIERKVTPVIRRRESKVLTTEKKPAVKPGSPTISGKVRKVIRKPSAGIKNNAIKSTLPNTNAINLVSQSIDKILEIPNKKTSGNIDETIEVSNKISPESKKTSGNTDETIEVSNKISPESNEKSLEMSNKKSPVRTKSGGSSKHRSSLQNKVPATIAHTRVSKELEKYDYM
ncbi:hypothetical protein WDU94_015185 [Cyamophila willieti]